MKRVDVALFAALTMVAACAGTLEDADRFQEGGAPVSAPGATEPPPACPDVPREVFLPSCAGAGCHSAKDSVASLDLESPDVASRVRGKRAVAGPGLLLDPADPEASLLYRKMTSPPPFGGTMPSTPLAPQVVDCVRKWTALATAP